MVKSITSKHTKIYVVIGHRKILNSTHSFHFVHVAIDFRNQLSCTTFYEKNNLECKV